jgi:hypothetical protein
MNAKRNDAVKAALSVLSQADGGAKNDLRRRADIDDLLIAELRSRRRRLRCLLRLLDERVRRDCGPAIPAGRRAKASGRATRSMRVA